MSEDLLVDGYDYNPHTCMVEVPYNDYFDMKDKCKENKKLHSIIKEVREYITSKKFEENFPYVANECQVRSAILKILDEEVN